MQGLSREPVGKVGRVSHGAQRFRLPWPRRKPRVSLLSPVKGLLWHGRGWGSALRSSLPRTAGEGVETKFRVLKSPEEVERQKRFPQRLSGKETYN